MPDMTSWTEEQRRAFGVAEARIADCWRRQGILLDLSGLAIPELPESLRGLLGLRILDISYCPIRELPEWFSDLRLMERLVMHGIYIYKLPSEFNASKRLRLISIDALCLHGFSAHDMAKLDLVIDAYIQKCDPGIPDLIRHWKQLITLTLSGFIGDAPHWLGEFSHMTRLAFIDCDIRTLPVELCQLKELQLLDLGDNSQLGIPGELLRGRNAKTILDYYFRLHRAAEQSLNEFKLMLVGRGGVGKTSLVHKLTTGEFKEFHKTPGVQITFWGLGPPEQRLTARVWDFGGQEILHGTHRFFMTERAVYLVLLSGRDGQAERDAHYWLSLVRSFAGDAPVIVLLHRWGECRFEVSRQDLRRAYGSDLVFIETDSATNDGIAMLYDEILAAAQRLPGLAAQWPAAWRRVKDELPTEKKSWLSFVDFCRFAAERGVGALDDQQALAEYLHVLGIMLSYRTDPALAGCGVLNPLWATHAIYKVLNAPAVQAQRGEITLASFAQVFDGDDAASYPSALHPFLLALMRKFLLCLPLDERGGRYLIPDLLSIESPDLDAAFPEGQALSFQYHYTSALPEGLLPRFIVETYIHREPENTWRRGVVLKRAGCRALVQANMQARTIAVRVMGPRSDVRRELLAIIREHFERIHRSYEQLAVEEQVPVPGALRPVPYRLLRKIEPSPQPLVQVEFADDVKLLSAKALLDGVDLPDVQRPSLRSDARRDLWQDLIAPVPLLFVSYAEADSTFFDQLRSHLVLAERRGKVRVHGRALLRPGQDEDAETRDRLQEARLVVPLLSADYFSQPGRVERELEPALARRARGECLVVPVLLRACSVGDSAVRGIKSLPDDGRPITQHSDRDAAWLAIVEALVARLETRT